MSLHYHIITLSCYHITALPCYHITALPYHNVITSPHNCLITHITALPCYCITVTSQYGMIFPTLSPHYHVTALPHHHITLLPYHCITMLPHYHVISVWYDFPHCITMLLHHCVTISLHYHVTALPHHHITLLLTASFTPTSKVSWKVEAFSLCMFLLLLTLREVPHGTKGTGPRFVTRPVYSRSQPQEQHEHSFCSSSTNAFISYSLYTVRRYCTSPGAPDLRMRLG